MKGVAIFLSFAIAISAMAIMAAMSPVTAGKMNGKPGGGRNSAHYDQPAGKTQAGKHTKVHKTH
jgi:hypothetical protein